MEKTYDVAVAGAGPSGLAIASALARQGLQVVCVAPTTETKWENNSCAWASEIMPLGLDRYCDRIWPKTEIIYDDRSNRVVDGGYAHFDNDKLRDALLSDIPDTILGEVVEARHDPRGSTLLLKGGEKISATLVVDATGHDHRLIRPLKKEADVFQNVYGILARVESHPYDLDRMILMDFRSKFLGRKKSPPTFLYAMPWEKDLAFFEETSLAHRPGVPFSLLKHRLDQRLESMGIRIRNVEFTEEGALPMNVGLPDLTQRVVGFGAAAGFVHPSTGWSVARSLSQADPVASAIAGGIAAGLTPDEISGRAWRVMWPEDLLKMRAIHMRGLDLFCRIGIGPLKLFMKAFFSGPTRYWQTYLSWDVTVAKINQSIRPF